MQRQSGVVLINWNQLFGRCLKGRWDYVAPKADPVQYAAA